MVIITAESTGEAQEPQRQTTDMLFFITPASLCRLCEFCN